MRLTLVTVAPEFRKTPEGLRLLTRFRVIVWSCTFIAMALQWITSMPLAALLILAAGYIWALASSRARTLAAGCLLEVGSLLRESRGPVHPDRKAFWHRLHREFWQPLVVGCAGVGAGSSGGRDDLSPVIAR